MYDYTLLVEYLSPVNSCEIADGGELVVVSADCEEGAMEAVGWEMSKRGYAPEDFRVVDVLEGTFESQDDFWEARAYIDEARAFEHEMEDEEAQWEAYIGTRFDEELDDA